VVLTSCHCMKPDVVLLRKIVDSPSVLLKIAF
jgi:hypothetical protein